MFHKRVFVLLVVFFGQLLVDSQKKERIQLPTLNWDPRNEIFEKSVCNGSYHHIAVPLDSEMYVLCPSVVMLPRLQLGFVGKKQMYENMYRVSKEEFENCALKNNSRDATRILTCDNPTDPTVIKYKRLFFTSLPIGLTFQPNKTYYFIATSNGQVDSLNNQEGGRCKTNNMKIAITICGKSENCEKHKHFCNAEREKQIAKREKLVVATKTTTSAASNSVKTDSTPPTTSATTTTKTAPKIITVANKAPICGNDGSKKFGEAATASLLGGLFFGIILGVLVVYIGQYAKRYIERNNDKTSSNSSAEDVFQADMKKQPQLIVGDKKKDYITVNRGYRDSKEIKRLLSTSSNASSERYSNIPVITAPQRIPAPAGSIQV